MALLECKKYNINVVSITCDGAHVNLSTLNLLGCDLYSLLKI